MEEGEGKGGNVVNTVFLKKLSEIKQTRRKEDDSGDKVEVGKDIMSSFGSDNE